MIVWKCLNFDSIGMHQSILKNMKKLFEYVFSFGCTVRSRTNRLFGKLLCKWGHFVRAKATFKILLASWFLVCFFKRFRSFSAENLGSVGQRAAKLPAIKLWEWFDFARVRTRADWFKWGRSRAANFSLRLPNWKGGIFSAL